MPARTLVLKWMLMSSCSSVSDCRNRPSSSRYLHACRKHAGAQHARMHARAQHQPAARPLLPDCCCSPAPARLPEASMSLLRTPA